MAKKKKKLTFNGEESKLGKPEENHFVREQQPGIGQ